jgi:hypothetical protein
VTSWGLAVWPGRLGEPARCCSPRSRGTELAVRRRAAVRPRASARRVSVQRVSVQRASVLAPPRAAAVVAPASREAGTVRQRRAPPVAQVAVARPVLQPRSARTLSRGLSQELLQSVPPPVAARVPQRRSPQSEDRTGRPRCALLDSHLTCRSQTLPVAEVPHIEDAVGVRKFTANAARTRKGKESSTRSLALSEYSAPGPCGKARVVRQHRPPMPEPAEMGVNKCVRCCRRMGCACRSCRAECGDDRACGGDRRRRSDRADVGR